MSADADAKLAWLTEVLGVVVSQPVPGGGAMRNKPPSLAAIGKALRDPAALVSRLFSAPDVAEVQKALNQEVERLEQLGFNTDRLKLDRDDQERAIAAAANLPDQAARERAIKRARERLAQLRDHGVALAKAAAKVMGKATGTSDSTQQNAIYRRALEDSYGLRIAVPEGMSNTHFDRLFDMMGTVPRNHSKVRTIRKLSYEDDPDYGGAYGGGHIIMGDFGDATGSEDYQIEGTTVPANSFDVTTLHEMGHALDDAKRIMRKHGGKTGCGGWRRETPASIADAMLAHFLRSVGVQAPLTAGMVHAAIATRLAGGQPDAPDGVAQPQWRAVQDYLADVVNKSLASTNPWFKSSAVDVDGRSYVESYDAEWWSYEYAARAPTRVNNYQWRSPAEWFAEVYAITWLAKRKPPSGVDAAIAAYLWQS
ncbi:MAG: hypothetical protein KGI67_09280 [Pseudomonadota bacterium]|nr:hypothetical protein [Pseudomonadota bacterium]